jgi:hypothetical protein
LQKGEMGAVESTTLTLDEKSDDLVGATIGG